MARLVAYGTLGKFTWRMLATVLAGQSIVIFFGALVARALAAAQGQDTSSAYLWIGSGLAVLALLGAGLMRTPIGVTVGWLVQILTLAAGVVVPMMVVVGLLFGVLWVYCLIKGGAADADRAAHEAASVSR